MHSWKYYKKTTEKRVNYVRFGEKHLTANAMDSKLLGVDFHDFMEKEGNSNVIELASEFGLSLGEVKKLKKQMGKF